MLSHVILGLLRDGALHHGYELITEYRARSGAAPSTGSFYRELARLQSHGLVETGTNPVDADARRIPYRITEKGGRAFDAWLHAPQLSETEITGRLLFLGRMSEPARKHLLDAWQERLWLRSQALAREHRVALEAARAADRDGEYRPLCALLSRQMKHVSAELAFLEEVRADIDAWVRTREEALPPSKDATAAMPEVRRSRNTGSRRGRA